MIIVFNGPPGSGKDEAANLFREKYGFSNLSFKEQLFKETIDYFKVDENWFMEDYNNRELKEKKYEALNGLSRRQALIYVSEEVIKPKKGKSYFGKKVAEYIEEDHNYVISDSGFIEELHPLIEKFGSENIIIVQIMREGHNYSNDSRRYLSGNVKRIYCIGEQTSINENDVIPNKLNIDTYQIHNNGSIKSYHDTLHNIYEELNQIYDFKQIEGNADSQCDQS